MLILKNLIFGKGAAQGAYDTTLTVVAEYSIFFSEQGKEFCKKKSLDYKWVNNHIFVDGGKIYKFKAIFLK